MKYVKQVSDYVYQFEKIVSIILMGVMVITIATGVFFRYFLNDPLSWPEELAIFMLIWVTFIGGSMSIKRQQAAAVTLFIDRLNPPLKRIALILGFAIITAFCIYLLYLSLTWAFNPTSFLKMSPTLGIEMFYPYLAVPLGFLGMSIHSFHFLCEAFSSNRKLAK